eukprot:m.93651 g.93651  ORF g.93651 m.93651 type:complete len:65 (-) comp26650_c0_seq2:770-964(-)
MWLCACVYVHVYIYISVCMYQNSEYAGEKCKNAKMQKCENVIMKMWACIPQTVCLAFAFDSSVF